MTQLIKYCLNGRKNSLVILRILYGNITFQISVRCSRLSSLLFVFFKVTTDMQQSSIFSIFAIMWMAFLAEYTEACSCRGSHPQEHFCNADFVILARIKRQRVVNDTVVYKIRIRKDYKLSEKAYVALKSGRIITPKYDSMCGLQLEMGKLYAISGRVRSLKAYVNMCGYAEKWEDITRRQRKGLRKMYRYGCTCKIRRCRSTYCPKNVNTCNWTSACHTQEGICLRQANNQCNWTKNALLGRCLRNEKNPLTISRWSG
ncbi:hypothetical protein WA026_012146 [Henosepilachna vigintioctopunctata]|uniref:NTR domain-containing protein n=1 Tax=Henosepilachna vigintioctopunctata TaxID=420089 RepID=A0AAW1V540_9CUCU